MIINLLKDGNGKYARNFDITSTWSLMHILRYSMFANYVVQNNYVNILDVGFGDNVMTESLDKINYAGKYTGIDLNEQFVTEAQKTTDVQYTTEFLYTSIFQLDEDKKFDCIILGELIEHLTPEEAKEFLKQANKVLIDGGSIVISTPNKINGVRVWVEDHEDEFALEELKALVKSSGFSILKTFGLWNNTARTRDILSNSERERYDDMSLYVPTSLLNLIVAMTMPEKSKQIILFAKKNNN